MQIKTVEAITALLNAWADKPDTKEFYDEMHDLSDCAIEEDVVDWYIGGGYTVPYAEAPEAPAEPEAPTISPATIGLIAEAINCNSHASLSRGHMALVNVRNSMARDGLIKRVDHYEYESLPGAGRFGEYIHNVRKTGDSEWVACTDEAPVEPVEPVEWLGDDFDF